MENIAKNVLIMLNNLPQMRLKIPKETGDLIGNKIVNKITKVSKSSPQNNFETVEKKIETPKGRCMSLEKRQKIIYDLRLI